MPIKKAVRATVPVAEISNDPRTAAFAKDGPVSAYKEPTIPRWTQEGTQEVTLDRALDYFFDMSEGKSTQQYRSTPFLVLNVFRATDAGRKPVAERLLLGQNMRNPYYSLHASPSSTAMDEYNSLQVTRHHPLDETRFHMYSSELQPKMDLAFQGSAPIARIFHKQDIYSLVWYGDNSTADTRFGRSSALWKEINKPELVAQFVVEGGWESLDNWQTTGGIIRAKLPGQNDISLPWADDARVSHGDIAYIDFNRKTPQLVSRHARAHQIMDVLVAAFMTVMTYETRRANHVTSTKPKEAVQLPGRFVQAAAIHTAAVQAAAAAPLAPAKGPDIEDEITCQICLEIVHNPVSLMTPKSHMNAGCTHNFCGCCILKNLQVNQKCPSCREDIFAVNDNRVLARIAEAFLEANPDRKRDPDELAGMDRAYRVGQQVKLPRA